MKQRIRLNERQLRQIVTESVKRILNETDFNQYGDDWVSNSTYLQSVKDNPPVDKRRESLHNSEGVGSVFDNKRFEVYMYPCDEDGNIDEDNAKSFGTDNIKQAFNIAAQFYRSEKFSPTVNIFDNEINEYIAEWG